MKRKKYYGFVFILVVLLLTTTLCFATGDDMSGINNSNKILFEIEDLNEIQEAINEAEIDGKVTNKEAEHILEGVSPDAYVEYIEYVDEKAEEIFSDAEPVDVVYDSENDESVIVYKTEIDGMSSVELVLTDCEENSVLETAGNKIKGLLIDECYGATNGQAMWKKYGKRYYTAKYTRNIGIGSATICTENHYTVSANGLKERYATTWLHAMASLSGEISDKGYSLYSAATSPGESTAIRARVTFKYSTNLGGTYATSYSTVYEKLSIKYVEKDATNKKIKVKYSWKSVNV